MADTSLAAELALEKIPGTEIVVVTVSVTGTKTVLAVTLQAVTKLNKERMKLVQKYKAPKTRTKKMTVGVKCWKRKRAVRFSSRCHCCRGVSKA